MQYQDGTPVDDGFETVTIKNRYPESTLAYIWYGMAVDVYRDGTHVETISEDYWTGLMFGLSFDQTAASMIQRRDWRKRVQGIWRRFKTHLWDRWSDGVYALQDIKWLSRYRYKADLTERHDAIDDDLFTTYIIEEQESPDAND